MASLLPRGFRAFGVHCGIKRNPQKQDVALIVSDRDCVAAGTYTQNVVKAAPVQLDMQRTPSTDVRAVVINSGNANACTGERGLADALRMTEIAAECCQIEPSRVLVLSTGIIGEYLPIEKIESGIRAAHEGLADSEAALVACARGMMTTDTVHKTATRKLTLSGGDATLTALAKGAAMIGPNMATMLAVLVTDVALDEVTAQELLREAVDDSFNCISVDGHVSTNDSVLLLASGGANASRLAGADLDSFRQSVREVCQEMARAIVDDGEGATHLITIDVTGCRSQHDARQIAKTVANSPLVKTAVAGADPNWGRFVSAVGYAEVRFDPAGLGLSVNGVSLYESGAPVSHDESAVSASIRENRETHLAISLAEGGASARFWATDLTTEYVRLNADYRT